MCFFYSICLLGLTFVNGSFRRHIGVIESSVGVSVTPDTQGAAVKVALGHEYANGEWWERKNPND